MNAVSIIGLSMLGPLSVEVLGLELSSQVFALLGLIVLLVLLGLSAFFSSSEIAMFAFPDYRIDAVVSEGRTGSRTLQRLKEDPHRLLVIILVGNNLVNIAMSSIATGLLGYFLASQSQAVFIATFGVTAMVLLFGESVPKSYAVEHTESWALRIARPLKYVGVVLLPLIILFDFLTRHVNRLTGGRSTLETNYTSRQQIRDLIETGEREGVLEPDERQIIQRTLRFNRTIAKEVMTPRLDIEAVSRDASLEEAIERCVSSGHARLPVYAGELDNVLGVVHIRDLIRETQFGEGGDDLEDLIRPTLHVPESKNVNELLREMREQRLKMAIVIDEFGTTEGLVTMEDLVEEIVGEILEGGEDVPIRQIDDSTAIVNGEVNIDQVNEMLDIELPEGEEFETVAGFIFNRAGRLVDAGDVIEHDGLELHVEQVEDTRISKVRLVNLDVYRSRHDPEQTDDGTDEER